MSALPSKESPLDILEGPHEGQTDSRDPRWTGSLSHSHPHIIFSNTESQTWKKVKTASLFKLKSKSYSETYIVHNLTS